MTQTNTASTTLISPSDLGRQYGFRPETTLQILKAAGLEPLHTMKVGTRTSTLYATETAVEAMEKAKAAPPAPKAAPFAAIEAIDEIRDATRQMIDTLTAIDKRTQGIEGEAAVLDPVFEAVKKLGEQNVLMFRALVEARADFTAQMNALQETIDQAVERAWSATQRQTEAPADAAQAAAPAAPAPATVVKISAVARAAMPPSAPVKLPKVAIVGLLPSQKQLIEKEYRECFDLKFYLSDEARGKAFEDSITRCVAVVAMISFINHGIEATIRSSGGRLIRINGGMSQLRDKLTELYITPAPNQKATG